MKSAAFCPLKPFPYTYLSWDSMDTSQHLQKAEYWHSFVHHPDWGSAMNWPPKCQSQMFDCSWATLSFLHAHHEKWADLAHSSNNCSGALVFIRYGVRLLRTSERYAVVCCKVSLHSDSSSVSFSLNYKGEGRDVWLNLWVSLPSFLYVAMDEQLWKESDISAGRRATICIN